MANDPLYTMEPSDPDWHAELAHEAEDLTTALFQSDTEREHRKLNELHHAIHKMIEAQTLTAFFRADDVEHFPSAGEDE